MAAGGVDLADAIKLLREQLQRAVEVGRNQPLRFRLSPIELTLEVVLTKDVDGKLGWQVFELGGSVERAATQTLKLTLEPGWLQPDGAYLSTGQFTVASAVQDDETFGGG